VLGHLKQFKTETQLFGQVQQTHIFLQTFTMVRVEELIYQTDILPNLVYLLAGFSFKFLLLAQQAGR
jgi:hypothetical protein